MMYGEYVLGIFKRMPRHAMMQKKGKNKPRALVDAPPQPYRHELDGHYALQVVLKRWISPTNYDSKCVGPVI